MALSTMEAKYTAVAKAGREMLWMKRFLQEFGVETKGVSGVL